MKLSPTIWQVQRITRRGIKKHERMGQGDVRTHVCLPQGDPIYIQADDYNSAWTMALSRFGYSVKKGDFRAGERNIDLRRV